MFKKGVAYLIIFSLVWNQTALAMMNNGEDEGDQRKVSSRQFDAQAQPLFNSPKSKGQRSLSDPPLPTALNPTEEAQLSTSLPSASSTNTGLTFQELLEAAESSASSEPDALEQEAGGQSSLNSQNEDEIPNVFVLEDEQKNVPQNLPIEEENSSSSSNSQQELPVLSHLLRS